tara:strand:+ start:685 stop:2382 length:1698 start_codon:yes stop_codon:yes gene_type:complete
MNSDYDSLITKKVILITDSPSQFLAIGLKNCGLEKGLNLIIYEFPYVKIVEGIDNILNDTIEFSPDYVIINFSTQQILDQFYNMALSKRSIFSNDWLMSFQNATSLINNHYKCEIITSNLIEIDDSIFGNFANKLKQSFKYQIRNINLRLMELSHDISNLHIADQLTLHCRYGDNVVKQSKIYYSSDIAYNVDFIPIISNNYLDIINAINGQFNKCLILDLDNTLWGGIIGDIGIENIEIGNLGIGKVFSDIQRWALELKQRGIILAICSKNEEKIAKEPFVKHPEMILKLEDISIFIANRINKTENIQSIKETLNIGYDSMVFIDDNKHERNAISKSCPDIIVPNLPDDPANYLEYIQSLNLFETVALTELDNKRHKQYQNEYQRLKQKLVLKSETEYIKSLGLTAKIDEINDYNVPRASQLILRSNQFNLRTIRYSIDDLKNITINSNYLNFTIELNDKFGNYGLICIVILEKRNDDLFIDNWVISCRAFGRQVELLTINNITKIAKSNKFKRVIGEYIPTSKNGMVKNIYKNLGFRLKEKLWVLDLSNSKYKKCEIMIDKND